MEREGTDVSHTEAGRPIEVLCLGTGGIYEHTELHVHVTGRTSRRTLAHHIII